MPRLSCFGILFQFAALPALGQHSMEPRSETHMTIHFFADVVGQKTGGSIEAPSTFNLGSLTLFVHAQPTPQFFALAEVAFEPTVQDYALDVERMEAGWSPRSWFQTVIGRYHTPLGYWNTTFHHGKWLVTTIENPLLFKFEDEGGPLPVHTIGLLVFGQADFSPSVRLLYHLGIGNGRGATPDPPQKLMDIHEGKSVIGALHLGISGFRFGGSVYVDKTTPQATPGVDMKEQILVGDATFTTPPWEILAEGAWIRHEYSSPLPGGETTVYDYGAYAQVSYQVMQWLRPYVRGEVQRIDQDDLFMENIPDQVRLLAGIRFDPIDALAVKLEGGNVRIKGENGGYGRFQVAFVY